MLKKAILLSIVPFCLQASSLQKAVRKTDIVFELLRNAAHSPYIGEAVTQQQHALQTAFHARQKSNRVNDCCGNNCISCHGFYSTSDEFIIAALLHDIGHQLPGQNMDGWGIANHEELGANFLKKLGFSETICQLVKGHIDAKKYLCATDATYYAQLSDASKQTLTFQGACMTKLQQELFEQDPLFKEKLALRNYDDLAKDPNAEVPSLEVYRGMVIKQLLLN